MYAIPVDRIDMEGHMLNSPCPNCGQMIVPQPGSNRLSCPSCNEELVWSDDGKKLLLEKPLTTYLDTGNVEAQITAMWDQADQSEELIDIRRRQATVELAAKWVRERIALGNRTLEIGSGIIFLCAILIAIAVILFLLRGHIQIDTFLLFMATALIAPFGVFCFSWPLVERFSIANYTARIQEERRILEEQERYFSI